MEGEWLAYLEQLAQQESAPAPEAGAPKPDAKPTPASPFVCEELPSE